MRDKRITVRHGETCKSCKQMIPTGSQAIWRNGYGIRHIECSPASETPSSAPQAQARSSHSFEYVEVRDVFNQLLDTGKTQVKVAANAEVHARNLKQWNKDTSWVGCSIPDMRDYI